MEDGKDYRTALPHVYAVGDVVGAPGLASASYDQGRFVGAHIADGACDWSLIDEFPTGIYTIPEISSVGFTERELTAQKVPYEVGHAFFRHLARAQITGRTVGMLKILFHRETREILGIHCFGDNAAEIIISVVSLVLSGLAWLVGASRRWRKRNRMPPHSATS